MYKFNVWLNNRLVDSVFYSVSEGETIAQAVENVRRSLVAHDGYTPEIKVTWPKGQRITKDRAAQFAIIAERENNFWSSVEC